jgi:hypothetical protein
VPEHRIEGVGEVDAEDLLARLDADNVHDVGADEVGFSCLYTAGHANGDRNPSAHINRDSLLWRCKGCRRTGNLLELVKVGLPDNASHVEALHWLRENFGELERKPVGGSLANDLRARLEKVRFVPPAPRLPNEAETIGPQGILAMDWRSDHEAAVYMRGRGFAPEVLEDWGFGYDHWTERVAIPVRDERGTLVGFKGRAIRPTSVKYLLLGDTAGREPRYGVGYGFDMHDHNKVVFGLDRAIKFFESAGAPAELSPGVVAAQADPTRADQLETMGVRSREQSSAYRRRRRVAVPEGELDVVACFAAGEPAVCPGTTSISKAQLWLLRAHLDELVLFYDPGAGDDAVWGYVDPDNGRWRPGLVETISPFFKLYVVDEHEGDPASMAPEQVRTLIAEAKHWLSVAFTSDALV